METFMRVEAAVVSMPAPDRTLKRVRVSPVLFGELVADLTDGDSTRAFVVENIRLKLAQNVPLIPDIRVRYDTLVIEAVEMGIVIIIGRKEPHAAPN